MKLKTRADRIRRILKERYPQAVTPLYHETPFQLLVATILSAQCTDNQVNKVTRQLRRMILPGPKFEPLKNISGRPVSTTTRPKILKTAAK